MHEVNYNHVVQKATEYLESSGPGPERDEISAKLDDVKTRWEELKTKTDERHAQLAEILPLAQKYHDNSQNVKDVITLAETELGSGASVSPDVEIAKQELHNIKVCCFVLSLQYHRRKFPSVVCTLRHHRYSTNEVSLVGFFAV